MFDYLDWYVISTGDYSRWQQFFLQGYALPLFWRGKNGLFCFSKYILCFLFELDMHKVNNETLYVVDIP